MEVFNGQMIVLYGFVQQVLLKRYKDKHQVANPTYQQGSNPTDSVDVDLIISILFIARARAKYKLVEPYYMQDSNPLEPTIT